MHTVYKYPLDFDPGTGEAEVVLPKNAEPLIVQMQGIQHMLWAKVNPNPDLPQEQRRFRILGTGHGILSKYETKYISTIFDGPFVFHVFEILGEDDETEA